VKLNVKNREINMSIDKATDFFSNILVQQTTSWYAYITVLIPVLYWLYYRKYRHYIYQQKNEIKNSLKPRSKSRFILVSSLMIFSKRSF